jgi:hypothetical protein
VYFLVETSLLYNGIPAFGSFGPNFKKNYEENGVVSQDTLKMGGSGTDNVVYFAAVYVPIFIMGCGICCCTYRCCCCTGYVCARNLAKIFCFFFALSPIITWSFILMMATYQTSYQEPSWCDTAVNKGWCAVEAKKEKMHECCPSACGMRNQLIDNDCATGGMFNAIRRL